MTLTPEILLPAYVITDHTAYIWEFSTDVTCGIAANNGSNTAISYHSTGIR